MTTAQITNIVGLVAIAVSGIFIGRASKQVPECPEFDSTAYDSLSVELGKSRARYDARTAEYIAAQAKVDSMTKAFNSIPPSTRSDDAYRRLYGLPADSLAKRMLAVPVLPSLEEGAE